MDKISLNIILGIIFSLLPELIPGFATKWAALSNEWKRAIRAYAGLVVIIIIAVLQYAFGINFSLPAPFDANVALGLLVTWGTFVLSAEGTYQIGGPYFPRKQ